MVNRTTPIRSALRLSTRRASPLQQWHLPILYLLPALLALLLVNVFPIVYTLYISLTNRNGPARFAEGRYQLTGFQNYVRLLSQSDFYLVLGRTIFYAIICVTLFFIVGLTFALILNNPAIKGRSIWRTLLILPWAVPYWITALIWKFLFHGQYGPINQFLRMIGINPPDWLLDSTTAFVAIIIVNVWLSFPFFMLILLGGLQSISPELYEAAELDGAGWWSRLLRITLPLLRPVAIPAIILSLMTTLKMFETVYLMTGGGPVTRLGQPGATELLLVWAYNQGFQGLQRFGLVGAFSIVVFLILALMTLIYTRITRATRGIYD
ncbi:carbohydrate ABC transporter permease [Kallotenue papyrolyticum]|uniref:carbohydrate ABC transporter permease n=1 Tax=Kallotenue papyrolyticum TaxID=1325125 RepID=UPI0004B2AE6D|nr:sugar ABC transporter permease [Kallotenue papyrolyticum]